MSDEKTMKDFESELENSFKVLHEGDIIDVTVIGISESEITVDLNYYTEGIIPLEECSNDPSFSIKNDVNIGDTLKVMVIDSENASGNVILSMKEANNVLIWDKLREDYAEGTHFNFKVTEAVPAGVVGYVRGIRAFMPASQIDVDYVEDTESYVGMTIESIILEVKPMEHKLIISGKMPAKEKALAEKTNKISHLAVGADVEGTVERLESYGAFINIGEDLTGLCHISQITNKFIKSPKEELKLGEKVRAKILKIDGDRISLSIKALKEDEPDNDAESYEIPDEYKNDEENEHDESPFAKLLQGIKL